MSNEITNEQTETETNNENVQSKTDAAVEQIVDSAVGLGKMWARHGLTIGKLALETSAASLGTTAKMLSSIAEALAPEAKTEDQAEKAA